jgi:hypothetical protein
MSGHSKDFIQTDERITLCHLCKTKDAIYQNTNFIFIAATWIPHHVKKLPLPFQHSSICSWLISVQRQ